MDYQKDSYKNNIPPKIFYTYITLIFLFVLIFSITFLITQFVEKQQVLDDIVNNYIEHDGKFEGNMEEAQQHALMVFKTWSFTTYFSGISTVFIFFVFVLFGRTKVRYGYFFRTAWLIVFIGASIFMFFTKMPLWQQILNFFITLGLAVATLIDLLKVNRKREQLKLEIRNEWVNKRNKSVKGGE